jgi:D-lactate dehydrogenase
MNVELLKETDLFSQSWTDEQLAGLAKEFEQKTFQKGEVLVTEGQKQRTAYVISSGIVVRTKNGEFINKLGEGKLCGFQHLFSQEPAFATIVAENEVKAFEITHERLTNFLNRDHNLLYAMINSLSHLSRQQSKIVRQLKGGEHKEVRIAFFDCKKFWEGPFQEELKNKKYPFELVFFAHKLTPDTVASADGFDVIVPFVNDQINEKVIEILASYNIKLIAMRCAGYNNVDLNACKKHGVSVVRVPAYSPYAVAEHSVALCLSLNRKIHRAHNRIREGNFSLDGLVGFDLYGKTVGVFGTGKIGVCAIKIWLGFGCKVICYDIFINKEVAALPNCKYVSLDELLAQSDILTLHCPLTPETKYFINAQNIAKMKKGVMIINTSRGGLINHNDLLTALENKQVSAAGLDVYENEVGYFFEDCSDDVIKDSVLSRIMSFNNVLITGHQAFLTQEALNNIAATTLENISMFHQGKIESCPNLVKE